VASEESLMREKLRVRTGRKEREGGILNAALHEPFGRVYIHVEVSGMRYCIAKLYRATFKVTIGYVC